MSMMTMGQIRDAADACMWVRDFDGEVGVPTGEFDEDGDGAVLARIEAEYFGRWSAILDLEPLTPWCVS
jgi:hypothetical protein